MAAQKLPKTLRKITVNGIKIRVKLYYADDDVYETSDAHWSIVSFLTVVASNY